MRNFIIILLCLISGAAFSQGKTLYAAGIKNIQTHREVWRNGSDSLFKIMPDSLSIKKLIQMNSAYVLSTNATPATIQTITIADETAGYIEVFLVGKETGTAGKITGKKGVGYRKDGGTLTLDSPTDIVATSATGTMATATWTVTTSSNNIIVQITGIAATNAEWTCYVTQTKL